jgi:hypothetical protein
MTDYTSEAETQIKFFFGKVVANRVKKNVMGEDGCVDMEESGSIIVPEFTGVWWIQKEQLYV